MPLCAGTLSSSTTCPRDIGTQLDTLLLTKTTWRSVPRTRANGKESPKIRANTLLVRRAKATESSPTCKGTGNMTNCWNGWKPGHSRDAGVFTRCARSSCCNCCLPSPQPGAQMYILPQSSLRPESNSMPSHNRRPQHLLQRHLKLLQVRYGAWVFSTDTSIS